MNTSTDLQFMRGLDADLSFFTYAMRAYQSGELNKEQFSSELRYIEGRLDTAVTLCKEGKVSLAYLGQLTDQVTDLNELMISLDIRYRITNWFFLEKNRGLVIQELSQF